MLMLLKFRIRPVGIQVVMAMQAITAPISICMVHIPTLEVLPIMLFRGIQPAKNGRPNLSLRSNMAKVLIGTILTITHLLINRSTQVCLDLYKLVIHYSMFLVLKMYPEILLS